MNTSRSDFRQLSSNDANKTAITFEEALRSGKQPRIEDVLPRTSGKRRARLLRRLLTLEIKYRNCHDIPATIQEYTARFPGDVRIAESVFDALSQSNAQEASNLATTSTRGAEEETSRGGSTGKRIPRDQEGTVPKRLGRYRLKKQIGKGAFGRVFLAVDPQLKRKVAVKVPHPGLLETEEDLTRFLHEARLSAKLRHPNICPVFDFGEIDGFAFLVMAYVRGQTLSHLLRTGKVISQHKAAGTVRRIALALEQAHKIGVVHRDLKPGNIMIDTDGHPVVMDFGLASRVGTDQTNPAETGGAAGTPVYMSPEQAREDLDAIGPVSDVYSLGVILYELLCRRPPFQGSVAELLAAHLYQEPQPPTEFTPDINPDLALICLKALAKEPADRYESMAEFAGELRRYQRIESGYEQATVIDQASAPDEQEEDRSPKGLHSALVGLVRSFADKLDKWLIGG